MSGYQQRYISITGPFCITPDTANITDLNPASMPLRNATFSGTVTAGAFVGPGAGPLPVTAIAIVQGTIVAQALGLSHTVTWNNAAVTFTAQSLNVTDTASAGNSILANWMVGGISKVRFSKTGIIIGAQFQISNSSQIAAPADGRFQFLNNATTGFTRLTLGLETALFPSLKVNGSTLQARLGDDSDYTIVSMSMVHLNKPATAGIAGQVSIGNLTQLTVGAAGAAAALPAAPSGYLRFFIGATEYALPYYLQA